MALNIMVQKITTITLHGAMDILVLLVKKFWMFIKVVTVRFEFPIMIRRLYEVIRKNSR